MTTTSEMSCHQTFSFKPWQWTSSLVNGCESCRNGSGGSLLSAAQHHVDVLAIMMISDSFVNPEMRIQIAGRTPLFYRHDESGLGPWLRLMTEYLSWWGFTISYHHYKGLCALSSRRKKYRICWWTYCSWWRSAESSIFNWLCWETELLEATGFQLFFGMIKKMKCWPTTHDLEVVEKMNRLSTYSVQSPAIFFYRNFYALDWDADPDIADYIHNSKSPTMTIGSLTRSKHLTM